MPRTDTITQERLKELLHYEPETGELTWIAKSSPYSHIKIGDVAGYHDKDGYIRIKIDGQYHLAHRLIFLYMVGWMPVQVDHDDHVRNNNRWKNLNPATNTINSKNQTLYRNNTSGHCGVSYDKQSGKWLVQTMANHKVIHLGRFTHKAEAIAARQAADIKHGFHENHGKQLRRDEG